jgi:HEPN domain-containing protein
MNEISTEWLRYAKSDLRNAEILLKNKSYRDCIWYCHQAIEKLLKAIISHRGKEVRKVHDLVGLLEEAGVASQKSITEFIEELNPYYIPTRYPEAGFRLKITYGKKNAAKILRATREVFKWLRMGLNHDR